MQDPYDRRIWQNKYTGALSVGIDFPSISALDIFERSVAKKPNLPALHYFDISFSYMEIDTMAAALAAGLGDFGLTKGNRVIIQLQNIPQYLISLYAVWKLGAIAVTLNPMFKSKELEFYINDCQAKIAITMEACFSEIAKFVDASPLQHIFTTSELDLYPPALPKPALLKKSCKKRCNGSIDLVEFVSKNQGRSAGSCKLLPESPGYLTYTSGTTGIPKGAVNTHANIVFSSHVYQAACNLTENDVVVGAAPFFHVTGSVGHLAVAALLGIPVISFFRFEPGEVLRLLEKWRATMMIAPLTVYIALLNHQDFFKRDLSALKILMSGGAPVPEGFVKKFEEKTACYIHNWYGLTETTSPAIITPIGARSPVDSDSGALSIGIPVPNSMAKIVDTDTNEILPPGEIGELVVKGPMVVSGYWQNPEEAAKAIKDGWLHTGDVAKMDGEGWFYLVDRKKDLINVSGYKVWPRDVEDVLYQHPAVKEAGVIGIPDDYRGETVKAYVTLSDSVADPPSSAELIDFCKSRMAAYKYPRQIEIVVELPKTLSGKILRRELRDKALKIE